MEQPLSLLDARVKFMGDRLALIRIPAEVYPFFVLPILQLLFPDVAEAKKRARHRSTEDDSEELSTGIRPQNFLNISVTPVECSVVCSRELAKTHFAHLAEKFNKVAHASDHKVMISKDDFTSMQVEGEGVDAAQRVLELTGPLAMAGISIFFISTYFSDFILVPCHSKRQVVQALENRGFKFEESAASFWNISNYAVQEIPSPVSMSAQHSPTATTPPPPSLSELEKRTFASLRRHKIRAQVDRSLRIVQCAAHYKKPGDIDSYYLLRPNLVSAILHENPRFLSLTVTAADPAVSLLLEKRLLGRFAQLPTDTPSEDGSDDFWNNTDNLLLGSRQDVLIPIMLNLKELPLESTGIVCGMAGRLAAATRCRPTEGRVEERHQQNVEQLAELLDTDLSYSEPVEISFLSTARAGIVIVGEKELDRAIEALDAELRPTSV